MDSRKMKAVRVRDRHLRAASDALQESGRLLGKKDHADEVTYLNNTAAMHLRAADMIEKGYLQ